MLPGLVELHTDHLEAHYSPRPKVYWDPVAAVVSFDGQLATSGITTVLDSLRVWREEGAEDVDGQAEILAQAIGEARDADLLRVDHFLHLRCEVPMPNVVDEAAALIGRADVKLASLMDHTPGQRQFRDESKLRDYYRGKGNLTDAELDALFAKRFEYQAAYAADNYEKIVALARKHNTPLASHDDTTLEHVDQAVRDGVAIAEFPTTIEAAQKLHAAGIRVLMGAPNLVRGGSHAGNVATADLAERGVLDVLSSDYVPASLLMAALMLPQRASTISISPRRCERFRRPRPRRSVSTIAAKSPSASAPTSSTCASLTTCRWCARSGGTEGAWREPAQQTADARSRRIRVRSVPGGLFSWSVQAAPARIRCSKARAPPAPTTPRWCFRAAW